jgi:hypothetical protein
MLTINFTIFMSIVNYIYNNFSNDIIYRNKDDYNL